MITLSFIVKVTQYEEDDATKDVHTLFVYGLLLLTDDDCCHMVTLGTQCSLAMQSIWCTSNT